MFIKTDIEVNVNVYYDAPNMRIGSAIIPDSGVDVLPFLTEEQRHELFKEVLRWEDNDERD